MTTKDDFLFLKPQKYSNSNHNAQEFSNLNLNQSSKSSSVQNAQFNSKTNIKTQIGLLKADCRFTYTSHKIDHCYNSKEKLQSLDKSYNADFCSKISNPVTHKIETKHEKRWKKDNSFSSNPNSILSLHISAYENSVAEAIIDPSVENENLNRKKEKSDSIKKWKNADKIIPGSTTSSIQILYEFPRQQENNSTFDPEVMQFKASQQLLNSSFQQGFNMLKSGDVNNTNNNSMAWFENMQPYVDSFVQWVNGILEYWDIDYLEYLLWLFLPIFILFILPIILLFIFYGCVIFLHVYGLRHRIREEFASSYWDGARTGIASFWDGIGYIWHGYECHGLDNVPDEGPALFVGYHGTLPNDIYYLMSKCILYKKRTLHVVGDKFLFKIPGWAKMCKVFCVTPGTVEDCVKTLKEGNLLIIFPGGAREALFSNPVNYQIMWGERLGFAKIILAANVPVIPMFTENSRDSFRTPRWGRKLCRGFYEKFRTPLCPIYGGFPVKMITHLGDLITFPEDAPAEDVKDVIKNKVADLIRQHQRLPGSIFHGMWQRIRPKYHTSNDILDSTTTSTDENSIDMSQTIEEVEILPHQRRQSIIGENKNNRNKILDPYEEDDDDKNDPEHFDNDKSNDHL